MNYKGEGGEVIFKKDFLEQHIKYFLCLKILFFISLQ